MLAAMHLRPGRRLRLTKRDMRCWFDQLVLPEGLRPNMVRPRLSRSDLLAAGAAEDAIDACLARTDRSANRGWLLAAPAGLPIGF